MDAGVDLAEYIDWINDFSVDSITALSRRVERECSQSGKRNMPANGCDSLTFCLNAGCQPAESDIRSVKDEAEASDELTTFIDRVIVPLLVERLMQQGHL